MMMGFQAIIDEMRGYLEMCADNVEDSASCCHFEFDPWNETISDCLSTADSRLQSAFDECGLEYNSTLPDDEIFGFEMTDNPEILTDNLDDLMEQYKQWFLDAGECASIASNILANMDVMNITLADLRHVIDDFEDALPHKCFEVAWGAHLRDIAGA